MKLEPYVTTVGLLFLISAFGGFSLSHVKDANMDTSLMLTPWGLFRAYVWSEPEWLLPYYFKITPETISPSIAGLIALIWLRLFFFIKGRR